MANKTSGIIIDLGRGVNEERVGPMLDAWYAWTATDAQTGKPFQAKKVCSAIPKPIVVEQTGFESATGTKTFSIRYATKGDYKK